MRPARNSLAWVSFLLVLVAVCRAAPLDSEDRKRVDEILAGHAQNPSKITYDATIIADPKYREAIFYLAENHTDRRVVVGGILATAVIYSGRTDKTRYNGVPLKTIPPDDRLKRILFKRLNSPDAWFRKKAWGLAGPFLESKRMDPEVEEFLDKIFRQRINTWEAKYIGIYFNRPQMTLKEQKLHLHYLKTCPDWKAAKRIYYQMEKRPLHYKDYKRKFAEQIVRDLNNADPRRQGCALSTAAVWAAGNPSLKKRVLPKAVKLLSSPSPFVASRAVMAVGALASKLPAKQMKTLLNDQRDTTIEPNLHGSPLQRVDDAALRALHDFTKDSARPFNYTLLYAPFSGPFMGNPRDDEYRKKMKPELAREVARARAWLK